MTRVAQTAFAAVVFIAPLLIEPVTLAASVGALLTVWGRV